MLSRISPTSWMTARRIRVHGLLLAVCLWSIYAVDLATPGIRDRNGILKGADFFHFYTLGAVALQGRGDWLYDMKAQAALTQKLIPEAAGTFFIPLYGPQVSLFFAPFARLSYGSAFAVWFLLSVLIYGLCCYAIWKKCAGLQNQPWTVLILAIAFPGFFHLLVYGQISGVALACFTLAYLALRSGRPFLAGLAMGSLVLKPQFGVAAAAVFLLAGEWRAIAGATIGGSAQLAVGWWRYGMGVMCTYAHALLHATDVPAFLEPRPYQTHSLRSFWSLLLPWPQVVWVLYGVSAVAVLALAFRCWRSGASLQVRYACLLFASVLVAPHVTAYDLVILAPAFLLLADWLVEHQNEVFAPAAGILLYTCYPLFLLGPLARVTHVQLSVVAMTLLVWLI